MEEKGEGTMRLRGRKKRAMQLPRATDKRRGKKRGFYASLARPTALSDECLDEKEIESQFRVEITDHTRCWMREGDLYLVCTSK